MRANKLALMILLVCILIGCGTPPSWFPQSPSATPEIPFKQPEPSCPRVKGEVLGIPDGTFVTIRIQTPEGWEARTVKGPFPGPWESVVTEASGMDYIVTAEAEGYISQPISYTIHISGETAYLVRDGQVTNEEAIHLDFYFVPLQSP